MTEPNEDKLPIWLVLFTSICLCTIITLIVCLVWTWQSNDRLNNLLKANDGTIKHLTERNEYLLNRKLPNGNTFDDEYGRQEAILHTKRDRATFTNNEIGCLADNIYHESANEPINGQLAVATVTMNRVADPSYPKTICNVVYERHIKKNSDKIVCMFSWTCKPHRDVRKSTYQRVLLLAKAVYFKHVRNVEVEDATLYHAIYIKPDWADPENLVATIGQHLFYRQ